MKDNDFVKDNCKMYIGSEAKEKILEMLNTDVMVSMAFYSSMNFEFFVV